MVDPIVLVITSVPEVTVVKRADVVAADGRPVPKLIVAEAVAGVESEEPVWDIPGMELVPDPDGEPDPEPPAPAELQ